MSKKNSKTRKTSKTAVHFQQLFAAADVVAQELLISGGVHPLSAGGDGEERYEVLMRQVSDRAIGTFRESDVDNHVEYNMYYAHLQAAHMIGFALGRRLAGVEIPHMIGGAK